LGVSFIGVFSALLALQLERRRELALLRALGLLPAELWRLVMTQTALMGAMSGVLSLPLGWVLAVALVRVINLRSFGWTVALSVDPGLLAEAAGVALVAALLAGIYPALRMARTPPALALREEA
jgi:putative ABC transport system permease protein